MLVVSDASPLNVLIRLGQVNILPQLFNTVLVPDTVSDEMSHSSTPRAVREWVADPPQWFSIRTPSIVSTPLQLKHRGERDEINLAIEVHADAILLDEEKPRRQAALHGLLVIGTVGILEMAADSGIIANLEAVHELLRKTDFRVSDSILSESLNRHRSR